jgi:hypothetical protein
VYIMYVNANDEYYRKALVTSRHDDEILQFQIVRGTSVIEEHERVLVEMIANPEFDTDEQTEMGMLEYIKNGYDYGTDTKNRSNNNNQRKERVRGSDDANDDSNNVDDEECNPLDDADCLVENMYSMWAELEDYSSSSSTTNPSTSGSASTSSQSSSSKTPAPWSSRSSPSGTYVRDPITGLLQNIDE